MSQDTILSYASPMRPVRGATLGNRVIGVIAGVSAVYSGIMIGALIGTEGWGRVAVFIFGVWGVIAQGFLALTLALVYFLRCRRLRRPGEILLVMFICSAPVVTGVVVALAIALPTHGC